MFFILAPASKVGFYNAKVIKCYVALIFVQTDHSDTRNKLSKYETVRT